jgi:glycosyltransferase involved in cell wall biosynthesis
VLYLHGHSVGGTNPSLIEAIAAGALVAAHDNPFNRWVLNERGGVFFQDATDLALLMASPPSGEPRAQVIQAAQRACKDRYLWKQILDAYESVADRLIERARK